MSWAEREADRRASRHPVCCRCLRCIGSERYRAETIRLKADLDEKVRAKGFDVPPLASALRKQSGMGAVKRALRATAEVFGKPPRAKHKLSQGEAA